MPTYEYRCPKGHEFERFQRMSDEPGADCPKCGAAAERLLSGGAGFIFKGEGFYITDSRSDDYKKAASSDKEGAAASGKGSDGEKSGSSKEKGGSSSSGESASASGTSANEPKSSKSSSSD